MIVREKGYDEVTVWDESEVMREYARCIQVLHRSLLQIRSFFVYIDSSVTESHQFNATVENKN
jgi:hypothetical protein